MIHLFFEALSGPDAVLPAVDWRLSLPECTLSLLHCIYSPMVPLTDVFVAEYGGDSATGNVWHVSLC